MKWELDHLGFSKYTESFRQGRKLLDSSLRRANVVTYRPLLQAKAHVLLTHVLANPDELDAHFHQFVVFPWPRTDSLTLSQLSSLSSSLILAVGYGYEVKGIDDDRNVNAAKKMVQLLGVVALPGALLVNELPFCEFSLWKGKGSMLIHASTIHP